MQDSENGGFNSEFVGETPVEEFLGNVQDAVGNFLVADTGLELHRFAEHRLNVLLAAPVGGAVPQKTALEGQGIVAHAGFSRDGGVQLAGIDDDQLILPHSAGKAAAGHVQGAFDDVQDFHAVMPVGENAGESRRVPHEIEMEG